MKKKATQYFIKSLKSSNKPNGKKNSGQTSKPTNPATNPAMDNMKFLADDFFGKADDFIKKYKRKNID